MDELISLAWLMYGDEPCRVCGKMIERRDIDKAVFAGYSKCNSSRSAHGECWDNKSDKSEWTYPED